MANRDLIVQMRTYEQIVASFPYVGVNAPMSENQIRAVGDLYSEFGGMEKEPLLEPFLGLMVSYKLLHGQEMNPQWARHYPALSRIPQFMDAARDAGMKCIIHYNTKNPNLCEELVALERLWQRVPDGWQLNVVWPDPRELEKYLAQTEHARVQFIAQVGGKAFDMVGQNAQFTGRRLSDYDYLASYVLFDLSGGVGKELDPEASVPVLDAIYEHARLGVAVAGGLGPMTMHLLQPLLDRYPHLSWDAQGQLRSEDDDLDLGRVRGYLDESYAMAKEAKHLVR